MFCLGVCVLSSFAVISWKHGLIPEGGGGGGGTGCPDPLKNHKNIGFLSNTGPEPLKKSQATKPAFNVGLPGRVAQSVTCLATDACLTADPGVASSIPARSHTFVEFDHEIISMVILLPSADSFKKGCCQLQAKVCAQITG